MKAEWTLSSLGDLCSFVRGPFGGSLKKSVFKPDGFAVYEQQHAINSQFEKFRYFVDDAKFNEMKRFEVQPGELIMSCSGTIGKVAQVPVGAPKGIINQALLKLSPRDMLDPIFLKLWMESPGFQEQLNSSTVGVAIKNVASVKTLKEVSIPLPSLEEQKRIVAVLDEAFAALERARLHAEANLKNARELFESYLAEVFSNHPAHWTTRKLKGYCARITVGHVGSMAKRYTETGIPFLRSQNVRPFQIQLEGVKYIDHGFNAELSKSELKPGDVAIVRTGYPGTAAVVPDSLVLSNCADLVIARPGKELNPHFLAMFLNSGFGKKMVAEKAVGAAQKHFNVTAAKNVDFSAPPITEQEALVETAMCVRRECLELEALSQAKLVDIEHLRQSLLQKAFAGELT